jgi:hypothetical protein
MIEFGRTHYVMHIKLPCSPLGGATSGRAWPVVLDPPTRDPKGGNRAEPGPTRAHEGRYPSSASGLPNAILAKASVGVVMSEGHGFDPTTDPGFRAAHRRAIRQDIALRAKPSGERWTVVASHEGTGGIAQASASHLALAAWHALDQLRPTIEAEQRRTQSPRAPVQRPRQRVLVPIDLAIEAYELLTACAEGTNRPDRGHVVAVAEALRARLTKAAE